MHDWKISEILNDEKPSKHFLDIAKKGKSGSDVNEIRDNTGNVFDSKEELNEHIRCFYKKLYEKKIQLVQSKIFWDRKFVTRN